MKKCSNCFQHKPLNAFYTRVMRGKIKPQSRCKKCNAEVVAGYKRRKSLEVSE